ncbi:MAG: serine/threonine-protein kinase [Anaerolineales bacterium]|nr:serine/threonine-protein kinase [Anaerolineales bacterium]
MTDTPATPTPATTTSTSLQKRPVLRLALQSAWVLVVIWIVWLLWAYLSASWNNSTNVVYLFSQVARIGLSLFTYSTVQLLADVYILLGFFSLAGLLFLRRSDDWFAIFLSLMMMTFGLRVTRIGYELLYQSDLQYAFSPLMMMGDMGIILLGWLYPDGRILPRGFRFLLPILAVNIALLYWPASPFFGDSIANSIATLNLLAWYATSGFALLYRYRQAANPNQREQIRWMLTGMMMPLAWFVAFSLPPLFFPALQDQSGTAFSLFVMVMRVVSIPLFLAFPLTLTIAIARYKLFDIDFLINRALVYGALTTLLASIFGLVLLVFNIIFAAVAPGAQATLGLAVSALIAGALFQPARKALQRFVDRTFYSIKIDYLKTPPERKYIASPDTQTLAPLLFSRYQNLELIGKGGMAEVYRAEHPTQQRVVAIKVLLSSLAGDETFRRRFLREAHILSGLEHPHIVRLFDFGEENGLYYMVMEYLNGANLSAYLKQNGRMPLAAALPLLREVADALDYAHAAGLVHRDVKPSNIMLDTQGATTRAVLTDFGISKVTSAHTHITASAAVLGTFDYIAPEQIQGAEEIDGRADVYALGVMTYQLLTGSLPFKRPSAGALLLAHLTAPPPDAREVLPSLPRHTALAIQRAMAKKPAERFSTASEFVLALG